MHGLLLVPLNTSLTLPKKTPNLVFLQGRFTWCPGVKCGPYPCWEQLGWGTRRGRPMAKLEVLAAAKAAR